MKRSNICLTLLVCATSACGGGSDGTDIDTDVTMVTQPTTSAGFATAGSQFSDPGVTFLSPDVRQITSDGGTVSTATADLAVLVDQTGPDGPIFRITFDGEEIDILAPVGFDPMEGLDPISGTSSDGSTFLLERVPTSGPEDVVTNRLTISKDAKSNVGYLVSGYSTDPAQIEVLTGTVKYEATLQYTARQVVGGVVVEGSREQINAFDLFANFDTNTVEGTTRLSNTPDGPIDTSFNIDILPSPINSGAFGGGLQVANGSSPGTDLSLADATYEGKFYGVDGIYFGGQISATLESTDPDEAPIVIIGGFSGGID